MAEAVRLGGALALALVVTASVTPLARLVAIRTDFLDRPGGYKGHGRATPYLGGCAVTLGFLAAAAAFAQGFDHIAIVCSVAVALLALGTVDDRVGLGVVSRLAGHAAAGLALWATGAGWSVGPDAIDLVLTVFWVVGLINAFNLMDNLDGATASVAAASALGVALVAMSGDSVALAALAVSLAGACLGFLPYNLAKPSRIFLGDGGSTMIGGVLAAATMGLPHGALDWTIVLASIPLVGLSLFDTSLVVISRRRRRVPVLLGARDHLTHRLLALVGSPRRVAGALIAVQLMLGLLALWLHGTDDEIVIAAAAVYVAIGIAAVALLEKPFPASASPVTPEQTR